MRTSYTTPILAAIALTMTSLSYAQSSQEVDMSRYESITDAPKGAPAVRAEKSNKAARPVVPGQGVETIGPSAIVPQGTVILPRPTMSMAAGGAGPKKLEPIGAHNASVPNRLEPIGASEVGKGDKLVPVGPNIVDKVPQKPISNADMPVPKKRTTEMTTEDAQGNVIDRVIITTH